MSYGNSGLPVPTHYSQSRRRDEHYYPMQQAHSIPAYHAATPGFFNPRMPFQPALPGAPAQPPFPSPQYGAGQDPTPFPAHWDVISPNPPSSDASGFPSPGDYRNLPPPPTDFPVPSTDHVPLGSIYHPPAMPEPRIAQHLPVSSPYAHGPPTRIQSVSSFVQPTIQMPEAQPSTASPYPPYQQNMWDPRNTTYQREGHFISENRAGEWDPTGYNAHAQPPEVNPLESHVPPVNVLNQQAPLYAGGRNTEAHLDRPSKHRPPASEREQTRKQNHYPPLNQQVQSFNSERAHITNHRPVQLGEHRDQQQSFSSASSPRPVHEEQRRNERLRPPPSPRPSPAHSLDRGRSQIFRPQTLGPHSIVSDAPPSYTSSPSPQMSAASSPRPYTAAAPSRPAADSGRTLDVDTLSAQLQNGVNFRSRLSSPGRASGSRPSGTTRMNGASNSDAPNVDRSQRLRGDKRVETSRNEKYRLDYAYGGRKKALLIGINYMGTYHELRGCVNDVSRTHRFLIERGGYRKRDIVILTDDSGEQQKLPTRYNIIRCMKELVESAEEDDKLFLQYSGHGGQTLDLDGDEDDGMDETIKPLDYEKNGDIVDDELHTVLVKPLPQGCRLTALVDSCHAGTILDLPYIYRYDTSTGSIGLEISRRGLHKATESDVILFAGCLDAQTADDTSENGLPVGAMNWAFTDALVTKPKQTLRELYSNIRAIQYKYHQTPLLSASHETDLDELFVY